MRLRFLDMEPEKSSPTPRGDRAAADFVELWHRALAAATATSIHLDGPGRFYFTGLNIACLDLAPAQAIPEEMVKMSPLQSYPVEILPEDPTLAVIGAGIAAQLAEELLNRHGCFRLCSIEGPECSLPIPTA